VQTREVSPGVPLAQARDQNGRMNETYVCLATIGDPDEARVIAARLSSEGLQVRTHSESTGPFPVTVGALAATQLWVRADDAIDAATVLEEVGIACAPWDLYESPEG